MRKEASQKPEFMSPEKMGGAMKPKGMQPWIAEDYLQPAPCRRVFGKYRSNVLSQSLKQGSIPFFYIPGAPW
jgi:hypothetical protein